LSDCLFLPLAQRSGGMRELSGWEAVWMPLGEGEAERLTLGRGVGWEPIEVPRQLAAADGSQAVWYRTEFPRPDHSGRVLLRIGGAFLATHAWLNGKLLGSHYGYFAPFGFDLTPHLKGENLLVICCESPVETQPDKKRHIMGIFNDGELKPYPASAYSSLPDPYRWEVPVGLWRPVGLEYIGPIAVDWMRLNPRFEAGDGRLEVEARLRNLDGRQMDGQVELVISSATSAADRPVVPLRLHREVRLAGGGEQTISMQIALPGARRWEPWRFGEQPLYRAEMIARATGGVESTRVEDAFAFRELKWDIGPRRWSLAVNGRPIFLRGACYAPSYRLDELTPERFDADLRTAKDTNLDALRILANVLPAEFYRQADEAGMLLLQELPLFGAYAYHARGDDGRFFEAAAREQQAEMVELLRNRPSVAVWVAHDDPPWLAGNADLGDVNAVRQNHSIDHELKAAFEHLDRTRPSLAASGDVDQHALLGWASGSWHSSNESEPVLVSAFGAQSLPVIDSPVWESIGRRWPVADDDPAWRHAGFQPVNWAERGVGLPSAQTSLESYIESSQAFQAHLIRFTAEHLRIRKFEPCCGAFAYHLIDPFPGIGFGLMDSARHPKPALAALAQAFRPTRLIIEALAFDPDRPFGIMQRPAIPFSARLVIVNDDPDMNGAGVVRWTLQRERRAGRRGVSRIADAIQRRFSGAADVEVPTAIEPAVNATTLSVPLEVEGDYRLDASLTVSGREVDRTELRFTVTSTLPSPRPRPELPRYLAEGLADLASLRAERDGLSFVLENRTRPAVVAGITGLRLDGVPLSRHDIQVETHAGRAPFPRHLDLPVGRRLRIHVVTGEPLGAGRHSLDADVTVPGVASGRVVITGAGQGG
jgi:beta-mannosidase